MKVVFLTAGAAGMYCGSCMHDNALAKALQQQGVDCILQPVYTPIRTDSESIADERVFFGGINIYLLQQMPWLRRVPRFLRGVLDWPPLIRWATRRAASTDAAKLGQLSVSMLQGKDGRQRDEVIRFVDWLAQEMKPDAIVLSNLLIGGAIPEVRRRLPDTQIAVVLQGDDIFLDHLTEPYRDQAIEYCQKLVPDVDHFIVNSQFYADKMSQLLRIPERKISIHPLSIDLKPFSIDVAETSSEEFRVGYFARLAPEKGLHFLVDSFIELASQEQNHDLQLHVGGWLGPANEPYFEKQKSKLDQAGLMDRFFYHGSPDIQGKVQFLQSVDLLCVPTEYQEPKGLFVLEALAAGVPVVQPDHGAFGELIESTGGGLLFSPGNIQQLGQRIEQLKGDRSLLAQLGQVGREAVIRKHSISSAADQMVDCLGRPKS